MAEVTQEQIDQWKTASAVFTVAIAGNKYYYRPVYRGEMAEVMNAVQSEGATPYGSQSAVEDQVVIKAILDPVIDINTVKTLPAGLVTTLSELIMQASGFEPDAIPQQL